MSAEGVSPNNTLVVDLHVINRNLILKPKIWKTNRSTKNMDKRQTKKHPQIEGGYSVYYNKPLN